MTDPIDRAVDVALQPTWQIVLTCHGQKVQVGWSPNVHAEAVPMILVDQAKQLLETQFNARRKDGPSIIVPSVVLKPGNGGR